ncbi:MAG: YihA family ribosome biogenesis GTP-binding protein, partial [FCB group bacterium]|nr:YihA family ribosome biogenesis GTP-binding protein [FCB group bacterium]
MGSGLIAAKFVDSVYDTRKVPSDRRAAVAFAGRSNVGKSTLINSITEGKKIAKVSQTPGKTQALNYFMADNKFYLVDLPGYGFAKVPPAVKKSWGKLVEGYLTQDQNLRGLVLLLDCRREIQKDDIMLLDWVVNRDLPFAIIMTKADKLSRNQLLPTIRKMHKLIYGDDESGVLIPFSAKSGLGKKEVLSWVRKIVM